LTLSSSPESSKYIDIRDTKKISPPSLLPSLSEGISSLFLLLFELMFDAGGDSGGSGDIFPITIQTVFVGSYRDQRDSREKPSELRF
jgi:hypothetical protein